MQPIATRLSRRPCPSRLLGRLFDLPVVGDRTSLQMYWYHLDHQVCHITNHRNTTRRTSARLVASLRRRLVAFFFALSSVVDQLLSVVQARALLSGWTGRCARPSAVSTLLFDAVPGGARGARSCGAGPRALRALTLCPRQAGCKNWRSDACAAKSFRSETSSIDNSHSQNEQLAPRVMLFARQSYELAAGKTLANTTTTAPRLGQPVRRPRASRGRRRRADDDSTSSGSPHAAGAPTQRRRHRKDAK